jgi:hypothetical protein
MRTDSHFHRKRSLRFRHGETGPSLQKLFLCASTNTTPGLWRKHTLAVHKFQKQGDLGRQDAVVTRFIEQHGEDFERKITPHWIGHVRRKLGLKTEKRHGSYLIAVAENSRLARLFEKYGVSISQGDLGDSGDFEEGTEGSAPSRNGPII